MTRLCLSLSKSPPPALGSEKTQKNWCAHGRGNTDIPRLLFSQARLIYLPKMRGRTGGPSMPFLLCLLLCGLGCTTVQISQPCLEEAGLLPWTGQPSGPTMAVPMGLFAPNGWRALAVKLTLWNPRSSFPRPP